MRQRISSFLVSILLIASAAPALAQQPGMDMKGPGGMMMGRGGMMGGHGDMMMPGMMGGRDCPMMGMMQQGGAGPMHIEGRLAFLVAELGITDAQKDAWTAYAAALRKNLEGMRSMHVNMMKAVETGNPVDRLNARISVMESRLDALREMKPALEQFYASLNADQKAKADQLLTGMGCMT
ncbi:Spy/CpxP family protein refolding chaperone [uncultured Hyphomicrobium sp.]|jgi:Spy/CpxP family protein refolding chaperone|uniref:Spy/CpxP family protein refolding chaperone n=1 Tax=uncultured Hyphomicrobium sp. TaxID=194373 RepID=UPI0025E8C938|nr:Spy/CpxP family protein refolding chaperone [uncultured Hyphomicrobium sp.]